MAQLNDLLVMGQSTLLGPVTVNSGVTNAGIKIGSTYLNAISEQVIFQNNGAIRFGGAAWDWNNWAGLKYVHSDKTISLGIADGSVFNANNAQTGGILQFPGIQYIDCAGLIRASGGIKTNTIQAPTSSGGTTYGTGSANQVLKANGSGQVYWGNATYTNFGGATSTANGSSGLVPAPSAGNQGKFLKADGTWAAAVTSSLSLVGDIGQGYSLTLYVP